jgi:hypothetical protein
MGLLDPDDVAAYDDEGASGAFAPTAPRVSVWVDKTATVSLD